MGTAEDDEAFGDDMFEEFHILGPDAPEHAWIGGKYESYETLAKSFLDGADTMALAWAESPHERLALPIMQTYRHAIELALKGLCEQAAQHITFGLHMSIGHDTRPAKLTERLGRSHSIAELVELFIEIAKGLAGSESGQLPAGTVAILKKLHDMDSNGQTFRYATAYNKQNKTFDPVRPVEEPIELRRLVNELHQAGGMLIYGAFGWLDAYFEWLQMTWELVQENADMG
jgi:hypothetical protein